MGMRETACWDWFWAENHTKYDRVGRNVEVNVSPNALLVGGLGGMAGKMNRSNYRIDAVVGSGRDVTLIEVKEVGNMTAIGQLVSYSVLFRKCFDGVGKLRLMLVALQVPPAIRLVCDDLGIFVVEAPDEVRAAIGTRSDNLKASRLMGSEEEVVVAVDVVSNLPDRVEEQFLVNDEILPLISDGSILEQLQAERS